MKKFKYKAIIKTKDGSQKKRYFNVLENANNWVTQWSNFLINNNIPKDTISFKISLQQDAFS